MRSALLEPIVDQINLKPEQKNEKLQDIEQEFKQTFMIHEEHTMLSKEGEVIFLASAVLETIEDNLTLFENDEGKDSDKLKENQV